MADKRETERAYYAKNRDAIAARKKAWRATRLEKIRETSRAYYAENKDKEAERNKAYRTANRTRHAGYKKTQREKDPAKWMLARLRGRAKVAGLAFDLTAEDCAMPAACPMLGIPLTTYGPRTDNTASMDRIDSTKGYVKGNVHVISYRANRIKNDATVEELLRVATYLLKLRPS